MTGKQWWEIYRGICVKHGLAERNWEGGGPFHALDDFDKEIINEVTVLATKQIEDDLMMKLHPFNKD